MALTLQPHVAGSVSHIYDNKERDARAQHVSRVCLLDTDDRQTVFW